MSEPQVERRGSGKVGVHQPIDCRTEAKVLVEQRSSAIRNFLHMQYQTEPSGINYESKCNRAITPEQVKTVEKATKLAIKALQEVVQSGQKNLVGQ